MMKLDTRFEITLGNILAGIFLGGGALLGGAWILGLALLEPVRDDVAFTRQKIEQTQAFANNVQDAGKDADQGLEKQLIQLSANLQVTNSQLEQLNKNLSRLDTRVADMDNRQKSFEIWVATKLGRPGEVPAGWQKSQDEILPQLYKTNSDPFATWSKYVIKYE